MKLTSRPTRRSSGMTLLELTVVILVLLSLISILFVGARAWKKGSDRAGCILNIRNAQQAVRSYQNMNQLNEGHTINMFTDILGPGRMIEHDLQCPGGGDYDHIGHIPFAGEMAITCDLSGPDGHAVANSADW